MLTDPWLVITALSAAATAVATAASAGAIVWAGIVARRALRAAQEDSRSRTRPVMVAELRRAPLSPGTMNLVLQNLGASVARDVTVVLDPGPPPNVNTLPDSDIWKWIYQRYARPITTWAPRWRLSNVARAGHDKLEPFVVRISYRGPDDTPYADRYEFNPDHVLKETEAGPSQAVGDLDWEKRKVRAMEAIATRLD